MIAKINNLIDIDVHCFGPYGRRMEYTLVRSARKSISITITASGEVVVRAPKRTSQKRIDHVINQKQDWIHKHTARVDIQRNTILPYIDSLTVASYEKEAFRDVFIIQLNKWSGIMGLSYSKLRLSSAKTRWGSCSSNGTISLNWKLGILPDTLLEYVIIHELAHIKHMNHSKNFWALVQKYCPNYSVYRSQLHTYSALLHEE